MPVLGCVIGEMKQTPLAHSGAQNTAQNSKSTHSTGTGTGTGTHLLAAEVDLAAKLGGKEVLAGLVQLLLCRRHRGIEAASAEQGPAGAVKTGKCGGQQVADSTGRGDKCKVDCTPHGWAAAAAGNPDHSPFSGFWLLSSTQ